MANSYIVIFKSTSDHAEATDDHIEQQAQRVEQQGGKVKHRYTMKSMRGFAAELPDDLKSELEKSPAVKYVGVYAQAAAVWIVAHFGDAEPDSSVSIAN